MRTSSVSGKERMCNHIVFRRLQIIAPMSFKLQLLKYQSDINILQILRSILHKKIRKNHWQKFQFELVLKKKIGRTENRTDKLKPEPD